MLEMKFQPNLTGDLYQFSEWPKCSLLSNKGSHELFLQIHVPPTTSLVVTIEGAEEVGDDVSLTVLTIDSDIQTLVLPHSIKDQLLHGSTLAKLLVDIGSKEFELSVQGNTVQTIKEVEEVDKKLEEFLLAE